jgi:transposase
MTNWSSRSPTKQSPEARVVKVSERGSNTTCPLCEERTKRAIVKRGLFVHCDKAFNADIAGAYNILKRISGRPGFRLKEYWALWYALQSTCSCGKILHR